MQKHNTSTLHQSGYLSDMSLDNYQPTELSSQPTIPTPAGFYGRGWEPRREAPTHDRAQILTALNDRLTTHYPPDVVDRIQSMISGTLAELDALPPYPSESAIQNLLSDQVYPFLAAALSLAMESVSSEDVIGLVNEVLG